MKGWAIVAVAALPCLAGAQTVRGTVSEKASSQPMAGAVVFLLDANQAVVARDLTTESGSYRLTAPRAGAYRVRTMRIGFRPVLSDLFQLGIGEDLALPLAIENVPVTLNAVRVERRANCPAVADVTPAYNAWNEVATALNAALLSSRLRGTSATIVNYDRWTEPGSDKVLRQGANIRHGMPGMPWRSISADSLHRVGFVVKDASGWYTFHALDLDVLLSDTFLEDHCLQLSGVDNGEIAIEFAPSRDRGRFSEIRGFVWLSTRTLELKRLQFRYVNIPRAYEEADAGGDLEFMKLRNGSWIISRWQVRMPTAFKEAKSDSYGRFNARPVTSATEVKTTGGDLLRVVSNGDTLFSVPSRNFEGKVLDSATSNPVPGARVVIHGTTYSTVANEFGRFRIEDVLPGAYEVRVFAPALDSLATFYQAPVAFVDQLPSLEIRVPSREQFIGRWCPDALRMARQTGLPGLLVGAIRDARDSTPVNNAEVVVEWRESTIGQVGAIITNRTLRLRTDAHGVYRACGPLVDQPFRVTTAFDGGQPPMDARIGASRVLRLDVWVSKGPRIVDSAVASAAPREPPSVIVEASDDRGVLTEFEARRAMGVGQFIRRAEFLKTDSLNTSVIVSTIPGARVLRATRGGSAWVTTTSWPAGGKLASGNALDRQRGAKPACYADVWIGNEQVYTWRHNEALFDLNTIQPDQIAALEFYASVAVIPQRFFRGRTAQCGVLVIWPKR